MKSPRANVDGGNASCNEGGARLGAGALPVVGRARRAASSSLRSPSCLFVALWAAMLIAARHGQVCLSLAMAPLVAGLLVRLFMIQHDCGHGSFLPSKAANEWIGRAIGVVTMTPYDHWRRCHAIHHATSGNLDRRGIGDIETLTVCEYFARNWRGRIGYRLYRHPLVMFGIGPAYLFLIANRLPFGFMRKGVMPWVSTMTTNLGILLAAGLLIWRRGHRAVSQRRSSDHRVRRDRRRLALLRAASVRADCVARSGGLEPARGGVARQFALPPAPAAALVLRQYRRASRASPCERHSVLSTSGGLAEPSRAGGGRPAQSVEELRLRPIGAVGRGQGTARFLSRGCRTGPGERRCAASFDVEVAIVDLKVAAKLMATGFTSLQDECAHCRDLLCLRSGSGTEVLLSGDVDRLGPVGLSVPVAAQ